MELLKTVKVRNPKNVLVQVPKYVAESWGLTTEDSIKVFMTDDGNVMLQPKKGYFKVKKIDGSDQNAIE